jgi:hypothetical protein
MKSSRPPEDFMSNSKAKMIRVIVALVFRLLKTIIGHDVFWNCLP